MWLIMLSVSEKVFVKGFLWVKLKYFFVGHLGIINMGLCGLCMVTSGYKITRCDGQSAKLSFKKRDSETPVTLLLY